MALCTYPELLKSDAFPQDAKNRALRLLGNCGGQSVGAYTDSAGLEVVRKDIADYITNRDGGIYSNPDDIFLTNGASGGIKVKNIFMTIRDLSLILYDFKLKIIMELLLNEPHGTPSGFMIPIPQYPLYSATISEYNAQQVKLYTFNFSYYFYL
jgi:alanine transaminase